MGERSAGRGLTGALTLLAVIGLITFVIVAIDSYERDDFGGTVRASDTPAAQTDSRPDSPRTGAPPVGAVATGGGGTAADGSGRLGLPVFGGLAALTLLAAGGMAFRQRSD